jgi:hypothetical protein
MPLFCFPLAVFSDLIEEFEAFHENILEPIDAMRTSDWTINWDTLSRSASRLALAGSLGTIERLDEGGKKVRRRSMFRMFQIFIEPRVLTKRQ